MGAPYALSSDLVSAWPAKSLEVAQYIDGQLPLIAMTQNAQTGTTYSLAATDFTKLVTLSNASPVTVTVPLESSVPWVAGTQLRLMNLGAGVVTVVGAGGVTINGSPLTLAQYKEGTLTKTGTNIWTFVAISAPGIDLISTTSFSAVTSLSLNNVFSATYENYRVVINHLPTIVQDSTIRLRVAGADNSTASSYVIQRLVATGTTVAGVRTTDSSWAAWQQNTTRYNTTVMEFYRPFLAQTTNIQSFVTSSELSAYLAFYVGTHNQATSYDGITLFSTSGTMTGSVSVYGYKI